MFSNPLVQTILLIFGAYTVMTVLKRYEPANLIVTVAAGIVAATIWMLRYNRPELHRLYRNPVGKAIIDAVCAMIGEQAPVDAVPSAPVQRATAAVSAPASTTPSGRQRVVVSARVSAQQASTPSAPAAAQTEGGKGLPTDSDLRLAAFSIKERLFGLDAQIDGTLQQIARNIRLRERSAASVQLPPLGLFLFTGRSGLGKRTLAFEIGRRLYPGDSVGVLDLGEPGQTLEPLVAVAKAHPYYTFILENVDLATRRVQDDLLTIASGSPLSDSQTGTRVTFRHCCFFLLTHKEAGPQSTPVMSGDRNSSFTVAVERATDLTTLDAVLAQGLHGLVPFHLPDKLRQAEAIAFLMAAECEKHQLTLGSVSPQQLAREVGEVSTVGSFRTAPARVARLMGRAIDESIARKSTTVTVN